MGSAVVAARFGTHLGKIGTGSGKSQQRWDGLGEEQPSDSDGDGRGGAASSKRRSSERLGRRGDGIRQPGGVGSCAVWSPEAE